MRKFLVAGAAGLVILSVATPALASGKSGANKPTCDARYYNDLVGQDRSEARHLGSLEYRLLPSGTAPGQANQHRITVTYDAGSNRITSVACG